MKMHGLNTKSIGNKGENIAVKYLQNLGYKIIDRNVYIGGGELDIIAKDGDTLVFVEVKARFSVGFGNPLEAVTEQKIKSIIRSAKNYIATKKYYDKNVRFDVIGIDGDKIEYIKDAFWLN